MSSRDASAQSGVRELSVVVPVFNDADLVEHALTTIIKKLEESGLSWELIVVDDASQDDTPQRLSSMEALKRDNVRAFRMVRNFGQHVALFAGLTEATKQWRLTFDVDYVSAFAHLDQILTPAAVNGHDLVSVSRRGQRKLGLFRQAGTRLLNALTNRATRKPLRDPLSPVKLVHRSLVEAARHYGELRRFLAPLAIRLARHPGEVTVPLPQKRGKSHYGFLPLVRLTLDFILNFFPGVVTRLLVSSLVLVLLSTLAGVVYLALRLLGVIDASPHAQVIILIVLGLSINGLSLGIIGEYHVRMYQLLQDRDFYSWKEY